MFYIEKIKLNVCEIRGIDSMLRKNNAQKQIRIFIQKDEKTDGRKPVCGSSRVARVLVRKRPVWYDISTNTVPKRTRQ